MKRKIFIGSSTEGLNIAKQVQEIINKECGDWIECVPWNEGFVFEINKGTLECLIKASRKYDYGIFIASKDDVTIKRFHFLKSMRDNVLFEMGLFLGSLGLNRAFLLTNDKVKLPSDFDGVTTIRYNKDNIKSKAQELIQALNKSKDSYCLKPGASAALALGYYNNYISKIEQKLSKENSDFKLKICIPNTLKKIDQQIDAYKSKNPSHQKYEKRPITYEYDNKTNCFWDMPTTLQTIGELVDIVIPSTEIGINKEKEEWIQQELRNFANTINTLIKQRSIYPCNITITFVE